MQLRHPLVVALAMVVACNGGKVAEPAPTASGACAPADPSTWSACDGEKRAVDGIASAHVHNHPVLTGPALPGAPEQRQTYLDVGDAQIVVVTTEPTMCTGAMTAEGTLSYVDLGGAEGTMDAYKGLAILDAHLTCK